MKKKRPILFLLFFSFLFPVIAGENYDYTKELKALEPKIQKKLLSYVEKLIDVNTIARNNSIKWPHEGKLVKSFSTVKKLAKKELIRLFREKFPKDYMQKVKEEANKKYISYKIGDELNCIIRGGIGTASRVKGRLREIGETKVRIGDRYIIKSDLAKKDALKLDFKLISKRKEQYIKQHDALLKLDKRDWVRKNKYKVLSKEYQKYGYVYRRKKWFFKKDLLTILVKEKKEALIKKNYTKIMKQVYDKHGYIFDQKMQIWLPKDVMESMAYKIKKMAGFVKKKVPKKDTKEKTSNKVNKVVVKENKSKKLVKDDKIKKEKKPIKKATSTKPSEEQKALYDEKQ